MENRLSVSHRILDLSYRLVSHYDAKTNQLLTLLGFNFLVVGVVFTGFFTAYGSLPPSVKAAIVAVVFSNLALIIVSVLFIRLALVPHVDTVVKHVKPKPGLTYFKDIVRNLGEEEYVKIFLGESPPTESRYYGADEDLAFEKCVIEDNARDIYAHAEILDVKTSYVKRAFNWTTCSTVFLVLSLSCLGLVLMLT